MVNSDKLFIPFRSSSEKSYVMICKSLGGFSTWREMLLSLCEEKFGRTPQFNQELDYDYSYSDK